MPLPTSAIFNIWLPKRIQTNLSEYCIHIWDHYKMNTLDGYWYLELIKLNHIQQVFFTVCVRVAFSPGCGRVKALNKQKQPGIEKNRDRKYGFGVNTSCFWHWTNNKKYIHSKYRGREKTRSLNWCYGKVWTMKRNCVDNAHKQHVKSDFL